MNKMRGRSAKRTGITTKPPRPENQPQRFFRQKARGRAGDFPIVGIGASAGGLEAITQLLKHLPETGMAFVLVQHLDPTHESSLTSLLGRVTAMQAEEARNNVKLQPNHLYVIPPNKIIGISGRKLKLTPRRNGVESRSPIDHFFASLAED